MSQKNVCAHTDAHTFGEPFLATVASMNAQHEFAIAVRHPKKTRKEKKVQTSKVSMVSSRSCFQRVAVVSPLGAPRWPFQVVISFGETETTKKKQKKTKT